MATILLSAAGAAVGSALGGTVLGLGAAVVGQAIGATVGRAIDSKLMGSGSSVVETGRIDRFRLTGASEGTAVPSVHGRVRIAGQVIWSSRFLESVRKETAGGGKGGGGGGSTTVTTYSYSVSVAIALCEGEITRIGRIWADGIEIAPGDLSMAVYPGSQTQLPDPTIEAVEGAGQVPAYRGTAYVVISDLDLNRYGNRVPQFTFEVMRTGAGDLAQAVRAVSIGPGVGEYALATTPVHFEEEAGRPVSANISTAAGEADFSVSLQALSEEVPGVGAVSVPVSWFASGLEAGALAIRPLVTQTTADGVGMGWRVSGITRAGAAVGSEGTPADAAVLQALRASVDRGLAPMLVPMLAVDPVIGEDGAAVQRDRSEIVPGGGDAASEIAAFFGTASPGEFSVAGDVVTYTGSDPGSYRRFVLHYAHLAARAGGVDAFLIGSDLRGLTGVEAAPGVYPAVDALVALAADVRSILGSEVQIGYAADWTEYGAQSAGADSLAFPLDPLWSSNNIDFVGINAFQPLSDWRETPDHADAEWGSVYRPAYLGANVAGGEAFDWTYRTDEAAELQIRTPIEDAAFGEPWVYRPKDLIGWWFSPHHPRAGGMRSETPTAWVPGSKPIWLTEVGCPALDKGSNAPGRCVGDTPRDTSGARDDLLQMQAIAAVDAHWAVPGNNPESALYSGTMVDRDRMFVWQWDARPYPQFPSRVGTWADGQDYARGHWLSGRMSTRSLASVVVEICAASGVTDVDVSELYGLVRGYTVEGNLTARGALQPLLLAAGADAIEREGRLVFRSRLARVDETLSEDQLAEGERSQPISVVREPEAVIANRVQVSFLEADGDYEVRAADSRFPDARDETMAETELPLVLTQGEGRGLSERWLTELRVARETISFALPPSSSLRAGNVVAMSGDGDTARYRIDRIEEGGLRLADAVRIDPGTFSVAADAETVVAIPPVLAPLPVLSEVMDLPFIEGGEAVAAPWVVASSEPWPGSVAVYSRAGDAWRLEAELTRRAVLGETLDPLPSAMPGLWDRGAALRVKLVTGTLSSIDPLALFSGGNAAIIQAPGASDWEVFQFRDAELVAPDTWALSMRLRGQVGTDGVIAASIPAGSRLVVVDQALLQLTLRTSQRGLPREYRIGPARQAVDHPSFQTVTATTEGVALRPYRPVHVRAVRGEGGNVALSWVRQTRIDGDGWEALDVPLGEVSEQYRIEVRVGGALRREVTVGTPFWTYGAADAVADAATGAVTFRVAQLSDRFGPGLYGEVNLDD